MRSGLQVNGKQSLFIDLSRQDYQERLANYVSGVQVNKMRWETRHYQLSQAKAVNIAIITREVNSLASGMQGKTFLRKINYPVNKDKLPSNLY